MKPIHNDRQHAIDMYNGVNTKSKIQNETNSQRLITILSNNIGCEY